jgi:hypothetical protein
MGLNTEKLITTAKNCLNLKVLLSVQTSIKPQWFMSVIIYVSQQNHTLVAIMSLLICHKDVANLELLYTIP